MLNAGKAAAFAGAGMLLGLGLASQAGAAERAPAGGDRPAIVLEDTTAKCGITWQRLPRDKAAIQPGVVYCGWQFDAFLFDADGDGHADLVSPSHHANRSAPGGIWLGRGDGTFGRNLMDDLPVTDEKGKAWIACAYGVGVDINADGRLDFYVAERGGSYINQGVRGQGAKRTVEFKRSLPAGFRTCIFSDFNRDGKLDLATNPVLLLGAGKGTTPKDWKAHAQATELFKKFSGPAHYGALHQGVSADFDRDGDLLASPSLIRKGKTGPRPRVLLFVNDGKANLTESAEELGVTAGPPQGPLVAADLDNDGGFDILAAGRGDGTDNLIRRVALYANQGDGKFKALDAAERGLRIWRSADYNIVYCSAIAADLDNDGLLDVVLGDALKGYRVFRNLGGFRFRQLAVLRPAARMARPAAADLNADGLMDLVCNEGPVGMTVYMNRTANANGWLEVAVRGVGANPSGVGALVEVFEAGKLGDRSACVGLQHVTAENDNHVPLAPHFGLGRRASVDVRVTLPTGQALTAKGLKARTRATADFVAGAFR